MCVYSVLLIFCDDNMSQSALTSPLHAGDVTGDHSYSSAPQIHDYQPPAKVPRIDNADPRDRLFRLSAKRQETIHGLQEKFKQLQRECFILNYLSDLHFVDSKGKQVDSFPEFQSFSSDNDIEKLVIQSSSTVNQVVGGGSSSSNRYQLGVDSCSSPGRTPLVRTPPRQPPLDGREGATDRVTKLKNQNTWVGPLLPVYCDALSFREHKCDYDEHLSQMVWTHVVTQHDKIYKRRCLDVICRSVRKYWVDKLSSQAKTDMNDLCTRMTNAFKVSAEIREFWKDAREITFLRRRLLMSEEPPSCYVEREVEDEDVVDGDDPRVEEEEDEAFDDETVQDEDETMTAAPPRVETVFLVPRDVKGLFDAICRRHREVSFWDRGPVFLMNALPYKMPYEDSALERTKGGFSTAEDIAEKLKRLSKIHVDFVSPTAFFSSLSLRKGKSRQIVDSLFQRRSCSSDEKEKITLETLASKLWALELAAGSKIREPLSAVWTKMTSNPSSSLLQWSGPNRCRSYWSMSSFQNYIRKFKLPSISGDSQWLRVLVVQRSEDEVSSVDKCSPGGFDSEEDDLEPNDDALSARTRRFFAMYDALPSVLQWASSRAYLVKKGSLQPPQAVIKERIFQRERIGMGLWYLRYRFWAMVVQGYISPSKDVKDLGPEVLLLELPKADFHVTETYPDLNLAAFVEQRGINFHHLDSTYFDTLYVDEYYTHQQIPLTSLPDPIAVREKLESSSSPVPSRVPSSKPLPPSPAASATPSPSPTQSWGPVTSPSTPFSRSTASRDHHSYSTIRRSPQPKSLFDRPAPLSASNVTSQSKVRRDLALHRSVALSPVSPPVPPPASSATTGSTSPGTTASVQDSLFPEWQLCEEASIRDSLTKVLELSSVTLVSHQHAANVTVNWDLVAEYVNQKTMHYRSHQHCHQRFETSVLPREEGKITLEVIQNTATAASSKKQSGRKAGGAPGFKVNQPFKANRPQKLEHLVAKDNNAAFTETMNNRLKNPASFQKQLQEAKAALIKSPPASALESAKEWQNPPYTIDGVRFEGYVSAPTIAESLNKRALQEKEKKQQQLQLAQQIQQQRLQQQKYLGNAAVTTQQHQNILLTSQHQQQQQPVVMTSMIQQQQQPPLIMENSRPRGQQLISVVPKSSPQQQQQLVPTAYSTITTGGARVQPPLQQTSKGMLLQGVTVSTSAAAVGLRPGTVYRKMAGPGGGTIHQVTSIPASSQQIVIGGVSATGRRTVATPPHQTLPAQSVRTATQVRAPARQQPQQYFPPTTVRTTSVRQLDPGTLEMLRRQAAVAQAQQQQQQGNRAPGQTIIQTLTPGTVTSVPQAQQQVVTTLNTTAQLLAQVQQASSAQQTGTSPQRLGTSVSAIQAGGTATAIPVSTLHQALQQQQSLLKQGQQLPKNPAAAAATAPAQRLVAASPGTAASVLGQKKIATVSRTPVNTVVPAVTSGVTATVQIVQGNSTSTATQQQLQQLVQSLQKQQQVVQTVKQPMVSHQPLIGSKSAPVPPPVQQMAVITSSSSGGAGTTSGTAQTTKVIPMRTDIKQYQLVTAAPPGCLQHVFTTPAGPTRSLQIGSSGTGSQTLSVRAPPAQTNRGTKTHPTMLTGVLSNSTSTSIVQPDATAHQTNTNTASSLGLMLAQHGNTTVLLPHSSAAQVIGSVLTGTTAGGGNVLVTTNSAGAKRTIVRQTSASEEELNRQVQLNMAKIKKEWEKMNPAAKQGTPAAGVAVALVKGETPPLLPPTASTTSADVSTPQ
ncbi:unnamed protein product [Cyprideis torosa]|uniref:Uncharacterized protein n=1 Tax=Cyprideis torosa TaxID=163714 RepID=A0A7R8ZKI8_9CRUS|nr:unnamed protein product [Cyprideis torosa]CAG0880338.1 unnamed protein product [Cyprideis torosa]